MNTVNPSALLRSLTVYVVCVPVAILLGYMVTSFTNAGDYQSMGFIAVLAAVLVFPLLMKWHYPLLVFSWAFPGTLFFLPGHPNLFHIMVCASLGISIVERILDRSQPFVPATAIRWPLFAFLAIVFITGKLTGGFGLRSLGSDVYGGKKYVELFIGILSFFAITARPIPKKHANLYITLFLAGGFFNFIPDLYSFVPSPLHFIYLIFPPSSSGMDQFGDISITFGQTRLGGIAGAAGAVFFWMLARHGFRGCFLTGKLWRPVVMGLTLVLIMLGGFRTSMGGVFLTVGLFFILEKMYRTGAMLVLVMAGLVGGVLLVPLASHLPYTFQRALAFLPLDLDPSARYSAESSTEWRLEMWRALMPEVPEYLLLGKGYAFSAQTFNDDMGANATFKTTIDAKDNALALSSDFHSGPLSLVIPLGIWGVLAWFWYWAAGYYVVWRNFRYGDPEISHINLFLYAAVIAKIITFIFVFGDVTGDLGGFAGLFGLSIALNHGVRGPKSLLKPKPASLPSPADGRRPFPRPAFPSLLGR